MNNLTTAIDMDVEVRALADYIGKKWTPIKNIETLFTQIRDAALHDARAWLASTDLALYAYELGDAREAVLQPQLPGTSERDLAPFYDAVCHILGNVSSGTDRVREAALLIDGKWDYSRKTDAVHDRLARDYPDLATALPHGWAALEKGYSDFDGMEDYDGRADKELFAGSRVEGAVSPDFVGRTALPYVMYDHMCQGRKAPRVLVGAVYSQFLGIAEHLNTQAAMAELAQFVKDQPASLIFEQTGKFINPHLRVLMAQGRAGATQAEYLDALGKRCAYEALSPEAKAERATQSEKIVADLLSDLGNDKDRSKERQEEIARTRAALLEAFGS